MKTTTVRLMTLAAIVSLALSCAGPGGDSDGGELGFDVQEGETKAEPEPTEEAYRMSGPAGDDLWILTNGRYISPVGERLDLGEYPTTAVAHPFTNRLYVSHARERLLAIVDTGTMQIVHEEHIPSHFRGMAIDNAGQRLWLAGGRDNRVYEYDIAGDDLVLAREMDAFGYPIGVTPSSDETRLYVPLVRGKRVAILDVASGLEIGSLNAGIYPYEVKVSDSLNRAIVSNWGTRAVSVFDLSDNSLLADITLGNSPQGIAIAPDDRFCFVTCSGTDDIHLIDLEHLTVVDVTELYPEEETGFGAMPTDLALSEDGTRLYTTVAGFNSIDVIDAATRAVLGRIPTEWYPTAVVEKAGVLYVVTAKGTGAIPPASTNGDVGDGSLRALPVPGDALLADYTAAVEENNKRTTRFYTDLDFDSPIPTERGTPSEQIKHVVFILKENKTYDQVFGDMEGSVRDPNLLIFGEDITPNLHAIARQFAFCDNYYSESHESDMGHMWATSVMSNDYVEKAWAMQNWTPLSGVEEGAMTANRTVFLNMLRAGLDFRIYGEVVGTLPDVDQLAPYIDFNYGFYTMDVSDRIKAAEVIREWEMGIFPPFIMILLPNDHAAGSTPGAPTADYYVADNDAGAGMLVDWVSKSEYWDETLVIITQDDPQSGLDHIEPHRTPFTVASPWVKHGYLSSVHYSMASMWLTIELILGLPPITDYDRNTAPMYDLFTTEPDMATYDAIPSPVPYEENPADAPMAEYSAAQDWTVPDQVERQAEIMWMLKRPGERFPAEYSIYQTGGEEDEEEEAEEGRRYREMIDAYVDYGVKHNLFTEHSLHGIKKFVE